MMIKTTKQLNAMCEKLKRARFITVDTEFIREKTYYPVLCLIQVGCNKSAWVIDMMAEGLDLTPFFDIMKDQNIIKVFHACRQDLEIFYHLMKQMPHPVFDTQVGAMVCGYNDNVSYQQLVKDYTGTALDKGMRITDWSHRPLTKEQTQYALHDVIELKTVYQKMMDEICRTNRLDWIQEEMQHLTDTKLYEANIPNIMGKIHLPSQKKQSVHLCARLCQWREKWAKEKNRPRKHILTDENIAELSVLAPQNETDLEALRTISDGFGKSDLGQDLIKTIVKAINEEPMDWPMPTKINLTMAQKNTMEALKLLLNVVCENEKVAPYLVATNDDLTQFIKNGEDVRFMKGWRYKIFGKHVQELIDGKLVFAYDNQSKQLICRSV